MNRLNGKVAVITGAGAGIGRATAELFAEEGAAVVIAERDEATGQDAAKRIKQTGGKAIFIHTDVADEPSVARLVRGEVLSLRTREYVQAAIVTGQSNAFIIWREILPNALSPVIVLASLMVATAILLESSLSFLGLGDPNLISWGYMVGAGRTVIRQAWWITVFPGVAIMLSVLGLNLIGEGLNDALNPRLAREGR